MKIKYEEIEIAVDFVSCSPNDNQVFLSRATGELCYVSEDGEGDDLPEDFEDGDYLEIPDQHQLGLKQNLVREFASGCSDKIEGEIRRCFKKRGAYRRFKDLLDRNDLLDKWHSFEAEAEKEAICAWCSANQIELE